MAKGKIVTLEELYGKSELEQQTARYKKAVEAYREHFGVDQNPQYHLFSAPGRTEISGNHTDHNNGKVLAGSVNLDIIAVVEPIDVNKIALKSEGFEECGVWLDNLEPSEEEKNTSEALIRGVVRGFKDRGLKVGGFKAYTTSNVLKGSGLSSSAAFEVLVGTILSFLYNDGSVNPIRLAQIAQFAENKFFGKPSGLMDQMACAVGGFVAIDFKDEGTPIVQNIDLDFELLGHALCIVDTKGDHADLTDEYAAIPADMKKVAEFYGVEKLRQIAKADILLNINELRDEVGDRAVLRALHFFSENERVERLSHALKENNFEDFLFWINDSGNSSYKYLQNVYSNKNIDHQELGLGLYMAQEILKKKGASRVHGGGFAGTIQVFVPHDFIKQFKLDIERLFGAGSCHVLSIRPYGGVEVRPEGII